MNNTKDTNMCLFFASDYHFEMITLPYIEKELQKEKEIVVLTDEDLVPTIKVLVSNLSLSDEKKSKILNINWKNDDKIKMEYLENTKKDTVVFIKGNKRYVEGTRDKLNNYLNDKNITCIDCYDINEVIDEVAQITNNYSKVLKTMGEVKL